MYRCISSWSSSRERGSFGDFHILQIAISTNLIGIMETVVKYSHVEYVWSSDNVFLVCYDLKSFFRNELFSQA